MRSSASRQQPEIELLLDVMVAFITVPSANRRKCFWGPPHSAILLLVFCVFVGQYDQVVCKIGLWLTDESQKCVVVGNSGGADRSGGGGDRNYFAWPSLSFRWMICYIY